MRTTILAAILLVASLVVASTVFSLAVAAGTVADRLAALEGTSRPVVILSDTRDDPRVAKQIAALDTSRRGLIERDIVVLRDAGPGGALRERLGVAKTGFAVVLVGKDGGVKALWRDVVDAKRIFVVIDAMPMRREEMRRSETSERSH